MRVSRGALGCAGVFAAQRFAFTAVFGTLFVFILIWIEDKKAGYAPARRRLLGLAESAIVALGFSGTVGPYDAWVDTSAFGTHPLVIEPDRESGEDDIELCHKQKVRR